MGNKTKIMVFHMKELIYTGIFIILGILFIVLLVCMFLPSKHTSINSDSATSTYIPGVYTASLVLNNSAVDMEIVVSESSIDSIRLVNLEESVTTMYPLIEPCFDDLVEQIYKKQSLNGINYSNDSKYTSTILLQAISESLAKASINQDSQAQ